MVHKVLILFLAVIFLQQPVVTKSLNVSSFISHTINVEAGLIKKAAWSVISFSIKTALKSQSKTIREKAVATIIKKLQKHGDLREKTIEHITQMAKKNPKYKQAATDLIERVNKQVVYIIDKSAVK